MPYRSSNEGNQSDGLNPGAGTEEKEGLDLGGSGPADKMYPSPRPEESAQREVGSAGGNGQQHAAHGRVEYRSLLVEEDPHPEGLGGEVTSLDQSRKPDEVPPLTGESPVTPTDHPVADYGVLGEGGQTSCTDHSCSEHRVFSKGTATAMPRCKLVTFIEATYGGHRITPVSDVGGLEPRRHAVYLDDLVPRTATD